PGLPDAAAEQQEDPGDRHLVRGHRAPPRGRWRLRHEPVRLARQDPALAGHCSRYFSRRERRRSAGGLPPGWQGGPDGRAESAKETSRITSPQTGHCSPVLPCTASPAFFSFFSSDAASPSDRSIAVRRVVTITSCSAATSSGVRVEASLNGDIFAACRTSSEDALPMPAMIFWSRSTPLICVRRAARRLPSAALGNSGASGSGPSEAIPWTSIGSLTR